MLEALFPCWPRLPTCYPDYLDAIRPAAQQRPDGDEPAVAEEKFDFSTLKPPGI